jgi:hypothetical protein
MRQILLNFSLIATLVFSVAFVFSFWNRPYIERALTEVIRIEVGLKVQNEIDTLSNSYIIGLAKRTAAKSEADLTLTRQAVRDEVSLKVARVVADMLNPDCECRKRLPVYVQQSENQRLHLLMHARSRLVDFIESSYASVAAKLVREFRIFTASNGVAFALLWLSARFRKGDALQLIPSTIVLVVATTVTGGLYLFNQNWLHTIVFGQYVGMAYMVYLAGMVLLLSDLVFNRARVTMRVLNVTLQALGAVVPTAPC